MDEVATRSKEADRRSKEEDEESSLSVVDSNQRESEARNLDLSQYCVSSDAETEKMGEDSIQDLDGLRPHISDLVEGQETSSGTSKRGREKSDEESDHKRLKVGEEEPPHHDDDENEAGDEGDGEENDELDPEADKETVKSAVEIPTQSVKMEDNVSAKVEGDEEEEEEEEEEEVEEDQMAEEKDVEKPLADDSESAKGDGTLSSMPPPIEMEKKRMDALAEITEIEYKFAELRQQLYENKLLRLQTELQMCLEGSHPELQTYYQKIASIREYKLRRAYQRQKYELNCIDKETRATRTFIHQDFYRQVSDIRNHLLTETTQKWYDINKERRDMDNCVPEVSYHVPIKIAGKTLSCITGYAGAAQQRYPGESLSEDLECENITFRYRSNAVDKLEVIVNRMRLNNELSDLEGLKKYFNAFPGAPNLNGLRDSEIFDDLQDLNLS
ncbi:hypothetical protein HG536_0F03730 [Torulaspora globosa]|uniref:Transcriptional regulatory protein DEP1 n=1 Tax=Torulaspora globosa TaxID=48254 RepID=A0A7G3ZKL2_9SACH|nr:uncharacterized protein HG536_0F03730 [Torulaspora globosa]QLL34048.1 hypothetical protein HG536_0F03730 [Torulaspora globosa]